MQVHEDWLSLLFMGKVTSTLGLQEWLNKEASRYTAAPRLPPCCSPTAAAAIAARLTLCACPARPSINTPSTLQQQECVESA